MRLLLLTLALYAPMCLAGERLGIPETKNVDPCSYFIASGCFESRHLYLDHCNHEWVQGQGWAAVNRELQNYRRLEWLPEPCEDCGQYPSCTLKCKPFGGKWWVESVEPYWTGCACQWWCD